MQFVTQGLVVEILKHGDEVKEYVLSLDKERKYNPGSFVQLSLDYATASDIWPESRTFSIASYDKGFMRFIIKKAGEYTTRIHNELHMGDTCTIKYPFGDLFQKNSSNEKHLLLAGGVGITPFLGMVQYFKQENLLNNVTLFYSVKLVGDFLHEVVLMDVLANHMETFVTRESCSAHHNRRINIDDIKRVADIDTHVYVCGSKGFNNHFKDVLIMNGYSKIHMDEWE